jgi:peptidoglycan/xylan/chitin deacetylase (PgdA/CDA1 family)
LLSHLGYGCPNDLMRAISFCLHDVADPDATRWAARQSSLYTLDLPVFRQHLLSIQQQKANVERIERFRRLEQSLLVFLTFDDGGLSALTCVADELEKRDWRGHFFITTDWTGQPGFLDRREIRELHSRGHVIGSHSCSHPERMSRLAADALLNEWKRSCAVLSDILGQAVTVASVPGGYYSRRVAQTAAASGIEVLFNSEPRATASVVDGCLVLGRYSINRYSQPAVSGAIAAGRVGPRWRQVALWNAKKIVKTLTGESYLTVRRYLLSKRSPEH